MSAGMVSIAPGTGWSAEMVNCTSADAWTAKTATASAAWVQIVNESSLAILEPLPSELAVAAIIGHFGFFPF
jgi:hypothetical protein